VEKDPTAKVFLNITPHKKQTIQPNKNKIETNEKKKQCDISVGVVK
jgi:hypothetical protein